MFKFRILFISLFSLLFIVSLDLYAQIIKDDFRVNNDTIGGENYYPDVEIMDDGSAMVIWEDGRNGYSNIYGQVYDASGSSVGINFKASTYEGLNYEDHPAISFYGDSILVIFESGYVQWLLSDGSQSGYTFYLQSGYMLYPDVEVSDSGFFVVWQEMVSGSGYEIFMKRFNFDGDSISSKILVNDDGTSYDQYDPEIAMDKAGNFVVTWHDYRNGSDYEIWGQLFDLSGNKIGSNFLINDDGGSYSQYFSSCAMDSAGNFVVVWQDYRDGDANIYGQRFYASGDTAGVGNFLINDDGGTSVQYTPSCAMDASGNFIVVWADFRDGDYSIYGQRFDNTGDTLGINIRIDQCTGTENQFEPAVSMNENNFVVTWQDERDYTSIYKRRFNNNGIPVGGELRINDLDGTNNQYDPVVDMNTSGDVVVTWYDYRELSGVYFQRLNALGDTLGKNYRVDNGFTPDVSVGKDGSYVITYRYGNNIFYRMFTPGGDSIGSPAPTNDTSYSIRYEPSIDMDTLGNFVITWYDRRNGDYDIYGQRFNSTGDTIGINFRVNDDPGTSDQYNPSVAISHEGRFLVSWYDYRNGNYDIYGQVYDAGGNPVGINFQINTDVGTDNQYDPDVASLNDGNFIVLWCDNRTPFGVYAQVIDSAGVPVNTNFMVSDEFGNDPKVSVSPSGGFVVTWWDYRDGNYNIYAQRFNPDYSPVLTNYKVNNNNEGVNTAQFNPTVATDGTNIIFTWQDPKWQRGWDIAAKVVEWDFSSIDEKERTEVSTMLLPNVPNPFINSTLIYFNIDIRHKLRIEIYDLSGRLIHTLIDGIVEPGIHSLRWNGLDSKGREVPAGIYFYHMISGERTQSRKMVLLR